jgi:predicted  nucleic acid-binding Zn-ribbon protein
LAQAACIHKGQQQGEATMSDQNVIDDLQTEISDLEGQVSSLEGVIDELRGSLKDMEAEKIAAEQLAEEFKDALDDIYTIAGKIL